MNIETHGLAAAYAVDALDDVERQSFERHLATCADCQEEVAGFRRTASELGVLTRTEPPPELKSSIMESIRSVRPLPPLVDDAATAAEEATPASSPRHGTVVPMTPRWARPVTWLVAAAAAAALVLGGLAWHPWTASTPQLTAAEKVIEAPDATRIEKTVGDATATVVVSKTLNEAVIVTDNMPEAPPGQDYQLWFQQPDGSMTSAGLMPHTDAKRSEVVLSGDPATAVGVGITVEPAGGSAAPTGSPIVLFEFKA